MDIRRIHDRTKIERCLRRDPELRIYCLGDLDDFFWPRTRWYGCEARGKLEDVVLVYSGTEVPTMVGISEDPPRMTEMLQEMTALLPERFHAHLSQGVEEAFEASHKLNPHGPHYRMALRDVSRVRAVECSEVIRLSEDDLDDLLGLYAESYPGNWFDETMLQTGQYFGVRIGGRLVSAAGVHVYSPRYRVAALGNIVTHPAHRSKGYGKRVVARLCRSLLADVDHIGLNVKTDNEIALACYRKLGFETVAQYGEFDVERKP